MRGTVAAGAAGSLLELRDLDPFARYAELRAAGAVTWDEGLRGWLVTGHDECVVVERREDLFGPGMGTLEGAAEITGLRSVLTLEGEPHHALHRFLARAMTGQKIEPLRGEIRGMAEALLDELEPEGRHRAVGSLRHAPAGGGGGPRAGPGARPGGAGAQQGLDGGGAGMAPLLRPGARARGGGQDGCRRERRRPAADGPRPPRRAARRPDLAALGGRAGDPARLERGRRPRPVPRAVRGGLRDHLAPHLHDDGPARARPRPGAARARRARGAGAARGGVAAAVDRGARPRARRPRGRRARRRDDPRRRPRAPGERRRQPRPRPLRGAGRARHRPPRPVLAPGVQRRPAPLRRRRAGPHGGRGGGGRPAGAHAEPAPGRRPRAARLPRPDREVLPARCGWS